MNRVLIAPLLAVLASSAWAQADTSGHVHTPFCNHQWSDDQGVLSFTTRIAPPASSPTGGGLTFVLNDLGGVGPGSEALAGFQAAAALWAGVIVDPITIRLDVRFAALGPGILGSTGSTTNTVDYATLRGLLNADATSASDLSAVGTLQTGALSFVSNEPPTTGPIDSRLRFLDNNGSFDNNNININTAQLKALGVMPTYAGSNPDGRDGSVSFSSSFTWDFDRSDGITPGAFDFVGVAAHEIGHALGFRAGVDLADVNALPGVALPGVRGLNNIAWGTVLDLYRYGIFEGAQTLDWSIGGTPCLSVDAGGSCVALLSTARVNGDGRQASHWKDDVLLNITPPIGMMDPTASGPGGTRPFQEITGADLVAFDIIGYDLASVVPEPGTWAMMLMGMVGIGSLVRRRA